MPLVIFLTRTLPKITTRMTSFISMNEQAISIPPWVPEIGVITLDHFIEAMNNLESHSNDKKIIINFLAKKKISPSCSKRLYSKVFGKMRTMSHRKASRCWSLTKR